MDYKDFCKMYGKKMKYYRQIKNYSQEELSEKLGVDAHYISDIECGRRNLTVKTIFNISQALETDFYKIFMFD